MSSRCTNYKRARHILECPKRRKSAMSTPKPLSGNIAVVTGGTRGIGRAIASSLLGLGVTIVITGRDADRADTAARDLAAAGGVCEGIACDLRDLAGVDSLGRRLRERHGRVDILVNNAGI